MNDIDTYLHNVTPAQKKALSRIRTIVKKTVPEVEEKISYEIPTFSYKGRNLLYMAAYKNHMSIYGGIEAVADKLDKLGFKRSKKGTLQFNEDTPIPEDILVEILKLRVAELDSKN